MAFRPFGKDLGPMSSKPAPFTPFGASSTTSDSSIQPPASQNHSAFAGQSFGPGGIRSGPSIQRAPPLSASQNPQLSIGKPYRPGGVQSVPPINRIPSPSAFQNPSPSSGQPYQPGGIQRIPEPFNGIAWGPEASRTSPSVRPYQFPGVQRPNLNPQYGHDGSRNFLKDHGEHSRATSPPATSHILSRMGTDAVEIGRSQDSKRKSRSDILPDQNMGFSRRNQSPVSGFENGNLVDGFQPLSSRTWMRSPSSAENNPVRSRSNPNQLIHQEQTGNSSFPYAHEVAEIQEATRRKSSAVAPSDKPLGDDPILSQHDSQRFSTSPPTSGTKSYTLSRSSDSQFPGQPSSVNSFNNARKTNSSPATKRTRSPPVYPIEEDIPRNSFPSQDCTEGEEQARAKRLARFKGELEPIADRPVDIQLTKSPVNKTMKPLDNKQTFNSLESSRDALKGDALPDYENSEQPSLIIGVCPDMCPESERGERERKGDLDHYERVDGDRNQTSKSLAVKKYTRTAEREAILIRPMPILQNTMEYLLSLLDRPYNENFLGMYNFLWDRMRAIRMDLRMQHIFNQEAITLLEQMIRLHIIAMHELCEYTKGEGFSEGFDAHLNIEQMNKTSVELFQMYDDHRKKGITVPTEKEFRGYYALLKLDKHPGYKVEPSELSLDLANMTPEIRQTSEVLFARNVARACRTGNFIAFFRLARKASYLQACLMHAHFSKLRTQALASLHSGLQINQGLPVSDMSNWIGMEEEDIEALLEYHGFSIKVFEEPYMVKNDLFLHADKDYKTKCSKLVHMKKSRTIVEDVSAPTVVEDVSTPFPLPSLITEATIGNQQCITAHKHEMPPARSLKKQTSMRLFDKEVADSKTSLLAEEDKPMGTFVMNPPGPFVINPVVHQEKQNDLTSAGGFHSPVKLYSPFGSPKFPQTKSSNLEKQPNDDRIGMSPGEIKFSIIGDVYTNHVPGPALQQSPKSMPMEIMPVTTIAECPTSVENKYALEESVPEAAMICTLEKEFNDIDEEDEDEDGVILNQYDEEVAKAKLKLIIRLWKRWSSRQSELRERRQLAAAAALNSLSLGTPIRFSKTDQSRACGEFNIDQAMRRRFEEREKSWSRLNISDVIADILVGRNPESKCISWKVVLCTQTKSVNSSSSASQVTHSAASRWLSDCSHSVNIICEETVLHSLVSHLSAALRREGISVFVDACGLQETKFFSIKQNQPLTDGARVLVVVISDEVEFYDPWFPKFLKVIQGWQNNGHVVVPVFYGVDSLTRVYGWANSWLEAEKLTSHQSKILSNNVLTDSELVEEIVRDVYGKLYPAERVGIYARLLEIEKLLYKQHRDIRSIGIWGMPGIGKTTLAKAVFNHMSTDYDASCFIENFDEAFHKEGLHRLLKERIGKILKDEFDIESSYIMRPTLHRDKLYDKRILVVLDDVRDSLAAESFLKRLDWFGSGSLIIITSVDKQVFAFCQINQIYTVQGLNVHEALQLFSQSVFGINEPEQNDRKLSMKVIDYVNGNPLALSIYGRELMGKKSEMETAFFELKHCPPLKIQDVLKNAYSALSDNEKNIVLDIAFFFKGETVNYVMQLLEESHYFPRLAIDVLVDKCVLTISENTVQMNNLIQDTCQEIFNGEIETCTRMWEPSRIRYLLEYDELEGSGETKAMPKSGLVAEHIESIFLDTSNVKFDVKHDAFKNMFNLKFLKIYNSCSKYISGLNFPKGLDSLPYELRLLHWENYPLQSLPQDFDFGHLVKLSMPYSQLHKLGTRVKDLVMLKRLILSHSLQLVECDILIYAQNIELIDLQGCTGLQRFPDTSQLQNLRVVNLSGCTEIKCFSGVPPNIEELHLQGTRIREIPIFNATHPPKVKLDRKKLWNLLENFSDVEHIDLECVTNLATVTSNNHVMGKLVCLNMKYCSNLRGLPDMVSLESLKVLYLSGCSELEKIMGFPRNLKKLYVGGTAIRELPQLPNSLEFLNAHGCKHLKSINLDFEQLPRHFIFSNCYRFSSQVIAEFVEKGLVASLARAKQEELIKAPEVIICIPMDTRQRSSFRLQAGRNAMTDLVPWMQKPISGFSMSVVVSFQDDYHNDVGLRIRCVGTWKTWNNQPDRIVERFFQCWAPTEAPKVVADHIFVLYDTKMHPSDSEENHISMWAHEVKFEFHTVSGENNPLGASCKVTECGVEVITAATGDTSVSGIIRESETITIIEKEDTIIDEEDTPLLSRKPEETNRSRSSSELQKLSSTSSKVRSKGNVFWKWLGCFPLQPKNLRSRSRRTTALEEALEEALKEREKLEDTRELQIALIESKKIKKIKQADERDQIKHADEREQRKHSKDHEEEEIESNEKEERRHSKDYVIEELVLKGKGKRKQLDDDKADEKEQIKHSKDHVEEEVNPPLSKCKDCKSAIEDGISINAYGSVWHPQCFCCLRCREPIAMNEISDLRGMYHKPCYKELRHPNCYVCEKKIPRTAEGLKYHEHPFWMETYCPSHDGDGTPKCCSCERLEHCGTQYVMLADFRWLCRECMDSAIMDSDECQPLHFEIREFFEGLHMKIEEEFPVYLVEKNALNKAEKEEKIDKQGDQCLMVVRGICLSEEQIVTSVSQGVRRMLNKQILDTVTESQRVVRKCEVTAILILYGLPRLLTGYILAHEMMHAYLRLNGYRNLNMVLEEGLCQVLGYMWLECQTYVFDTATIASSSSSSRTPLSTTTSKKVDPSDFEKRLVNFCKHQIETDESPFFGDGFRKVNKMMASNNHSLKDTLKEIISISKTPQYSKL